MFYPIQAPSTLLIRLANFYMTPFETCNVEVIVTYNKQDNYRAHVIEKSIHSPQVYLTTDHACDSAEAALFSLLKQFALRLQNKLAWRKTFAEERGHYDFEGRVEECLELQRQ